MAEAGKVYKIANENFYIAGCTISERVNDDVYHFSLAPDTDISAEVYPYAKLIIMDDGELKLYGDTNLQLKQEDCYIAAPGDLIGVRSDSGAVYTEISIGKDDKMNSVLKAGEIFRLKDLLPYQENKIINMDLINEKNLKFVIMSFDEGTGLSEHAAPGEAIVFALDGEATIGYEGKEHRIHAGENFRFAKGGLHYVKTEKQFKMALLLSL